jgi:hypothetical protein
VTQREEIGIAMFDPYHKWLGIPSSEQPPTRYRLLGISLFESDPDVIDAAANRLMAYLQGCATGPHVALSQKLLNEVAAARLCLLDGARKAAYDALLKRQVELPSHSVASHFFTQLKVPPVKVLPAESVFASVVSTPMVKRPKQKRKALLLMLGVAVALELVTLIVFGLFLMSGDKQDKETPKVAEKHRVAQVSEQKGSPLKAEPADQFTYLTNLQENDVKVDANWFSKNGHLPANLGAPSPLFVRGVRTEHMIFMHPPGDYGRVRYTLDRPYEQFISEAVIATQENFQKQGDPATPLTFEVLGDGKSLWKSNALNKKNQAQECKIGIKGVRILELRVYCPGAANWAFAGWNEPKLVAGDAVRVTATPSPRKYVRIPLDKVATTVSTRGMFYSKDAAHERLIFPDWKTKTFNNVPFRLVDPQGARVKNVILLYGPIGPFAPQMPKSVTLPCGTAARAVHFLSGVSGWGYPCPLSQKGSVSLVVRLHYADGKTEDHALRNGEHFADYISRVDVPRSQFAFALGDRQIRYLAVTPERTETIKEIELIKGPDQTAPVVMAVTVETR